MPLVNGPGNSPSPGQPTPGVVQQDKSSGGSVDTPKTRSGPQRGQNEQWREANRCRQWQTISYRGLVPIPPPPPPTRLVYRRICAGRMNADCGQFTPVFCNEHELNAAGVTPVLS